VWKNSTDPNGDGIGVLTSIIDITDKSVEIKLNFENPEFVSMSSQNEKDRVYFKFPQGLILTDLDGNPLTLDKASKSDGGQSLDVGISI
jgi:hypothetical protein